MRYSRVRLALVFGLGALLLLSPVASSESDLVIPSEPEILPLWEPSWSPITFWTYDLFPVEQLRGFCVADVDGDGREEFLAGGALLHVMEATPGGLVEHPLSMNGRFSSLADPLPVASILCEDLDGNGLTEILVGTTIEQLWVFQQDRPWTFTWNELYPLDLGIYPSRLLLTDCTGDGVRDLVICDQSRFELYLLRGDGEGGFSGLVERLMKFRGQCWSMAPGVFEGRRGIWFHTEFELLFLSRGSEPRAVLEYEGGRGFLLADLDQDGACEIIIADAGSVLIYENDGQQLTEARRFDIPFRVKWLETGDFNADGRADLAVGSYSPGEAAVFYGSEDGDFNVPIRNVLPGSSDSSSITRDGWSIDANADGVDDLVIHEYPGHLRTLTTTPTGRSAQAIPGSFLIGECDLNQDGFADWLVGSSGGAIDLLTNTGHGAFVAESLVSTTGPGRLPYVAHTADVLGDGVEELIVFEFFSERYYEHLPNGEGRYVASDARITVWDLGDPEQPIWSIPIGSDARPILLTHDTDGDGVAEIVGARGDQVVSIDLTPVPVPGGPMYSVQETSWGTPLAFLVDASRGEGSVLVGYRVRDGQGELAILESGQITSIPLDLLMIPLDLAPVDIDGDGFDELIAAGPGVDPTADEPYAVMMVAIISFSVEGTTHAEYFPFPGWSTSVYPVSYGGIAGGDVDQDGRPDVVIELTGGAGTLLLHQTESGDLGAARLLEQGNGLRIFISDVNGDGDVELVSGVTGMPPFLRVLQLEDRR